jgi:hypothetical protein
MPFLECRKGKGIGRRDRKSRAEIDTGKNKSGARICASPL